MREFNVPLARDRLETLRTRLRQLLRFTRLARSIPLPSRAASRLSRTDFKASRPDRLRTKVASLCCESDTSSTTTSRIEFEIEATDSIEQS